MESCMRDAQRYRHNAVECLLATYDARQPCYGKLNLSIATLWLAFARQDDAMDNLLASWDMAEPIKTDGLVLSPPMPPPTTSPIFQSRLGTLGPIKTDGLVLSPPMPPLTTPPIFQSRLGTLVPSLAF
jgi:hypothetical protein